MYGTLVSPPFPFPRIPGYEHALPKRIADTTHVELYFSVPVVPRILTGRRPLCATLSEQASAHVQSAAAFAAPVASRAIAPLLLRAKDHVPGGAKPTWFVVVGLPIGGGRKGDGAGGDDHGRRDCSVPAPGAEERKSGGCVADA